MQRSLTTDDILQFCSIFSSADVNSSPLVTAAKTDLYNLLSGNCPQIAAKCLYDKLRLLRVDYFFYGKLDQNVLNLIIDGLRENTLFITKFIPPDMLPELISSLRTYGPHKRRKYNTPQMIDTGMSDCERLSTVVSPTRAMVDAYHAELDKHTAKTLINIGRIKFVEPGYDFDEALFYYEEALTFLNGIPEASKCENDYMVESNCRQSVINVLIYIIKDYISHSQASKAKAALDRIRYHLDHIPDHLRLSHQEDFFSLIEKLVIQASEAASIETDEQMVQKQRKMANSMMKIAGFYLRQHNHYFATDFADGAAVLLSLIPDDLKKESDYSFMAFLLYKMTAMSFSMADTAVKNSDLSEAEEYVDCGLSYIKELESFPCNSGLVPYYQNIAFLLKPILQNKKAEIEAMPKVRPSLVIRF